jgi:demethylmenaquinone methyltransferase/2-methoxy-6-polyprenyl-1,4-benzoquinol methylase
VTGTLGYRGAAWETGPAVVYDGLAEAVLDRCPLPLQGARVLDLGAGTGAATRAAARHGAAVTAVDLSFDMLALHRGARPPAVAGDMVALPFAAGAFDAVVAAFSLTHVDPPARGLAEAARVTRPGGLVMVAGFDGTTRHPVKAATDAALTARGWTPPGWYLHVKEAIEPLVADPATLAAMAADVGLLDGRAEVVDVDLGPRTPRELARYRLGMSAVTDFVARLRPDERDELEAEVVAALAPVAEPLVMGVTVLTARR